MSLLVLVIDDEPDVEALFRQQFRRDIRDGRFTMDFAQSAVGALNLISDAAGASLILILSDINMPGMTGLELLPKAKAARPDVPVIMITAPRTPGLGRRAAVDDLEDLRRRSLLLQKLVTFDEACLQPLLESGDGLIENDQLTPLNS